MTPRLIPQWRRAWRFWSVRLSSALVAWALLPPDQQAALVSWAGVAPERVPAVLALLVLVSRLIDQPKARGDNA